MKKLITILLAGLFLTCTTANKLNYSVKEIADTRSEIVLNNSTFEVDNSLLPYVEEFINEAHSYDIKVDSISKTYMGIYVDYPPAGMVGVTFLRYPNGLDYSLVHPESLISINKTRALVFHEMAHKYLKYPHCHTVCDQLMSTIAASQVFYGEWEKQKEILFKQTDHNYIEK